MPLETAKQIKMGLKAIIAIGSLVGAEAVAQTNPTPDTIEAVGKWPITIALIALSAFSVWLMYRQAESSRQTLDKFAEKIGELAARLSERPCIRDPKNN